MRSQKMAEPPATPPDEWRCHRNDGKLWRCKNQKRADHSFGDDHYNQQLAKTQRGVARGGGRGGTGVRSRGGAASSRRRKAADPAAEVEVVRSAKRRRKWRAAEAMDDPSMQVMVYERRGKATAASGRKTRGKREPPARASGRGRKSISRPVVTRKKRSSLINPPSSEESLPLAKMLKGGKSPSNSASLSSFSSIQEKVKEMVDKEKGKGKGKDKSSGGFLSRPNDSLRALKESMFRRATDEVPSASSSETTTPRLNGDATPSGSRGQSSVASAPQINLYYERDLRPLKSSSSQSSYSKTSQSRRMNTNDASEVAMLREQNGQMREEMQAMKTTQALILEQLRRLHGGFPRPPQGPGDDSMGGGQDFGVA